MAPSSIPSDAPSEAPSGAPSAAPSAAPSSVPSKAPSTTPSEAPSGAPSAVPSTEPSSTPSTTPSAPPSDVPSASPSAAPSSSPSESPSTAPSAVPSVAPSRVPTAAPSAAPSSSPTSSTSPSETPSVEPSGAPSVSPSAQPSSTPSATPSAPPSASMQPSSVPSPEFGDIDLFLPPSLTLIEDQALDLESLVDYVGRFPRPNEQLYFEIFIPTLPEDYTISFSQPTTTLGDYLLIPAINDVNFTDLTIQAGVHFSGTFNLTSRATLRDAGDVSILYVSSDNETAVADVLPVCDNIRQGRLRGVEDLPGTLGANIVDQYRSDDRGQAGAGNNENVPETLIEFEIVIPPNETDFTHFILDPLFASIVLGGDGTYSGNGTAVIEFVEAIDGTRTFTIYSSILPNGSSSNTTDLLAQSQTNREQARDDILATLEQLDIQVGPDHASGRSDLAVTATSADVNEEVFFGAGDADTCQETWTPYRVDSVADTPFVSVTSPAPTEFEDEQAVLLSICVNNSIDEDNSEYLTVRITVPIEPIVFPAPDNTPIGEISFNGTLPSGVDITNSAEGVWLIEADDDLIGTTNQEREDLLNSVLCNSDLVFDPREGYAGNATILVEVISTERSGGGLEIAGDEFGGADGTSETETVAANITFEVIAVADIPTVLVEGNALGLEDVSAISYCDVPSLICSQIDAFFETDFESC